MKKLMVGLTFALSCVAAFAQEKGAAAQSAPAPAPAPAQQKAAWPVWLAFNSTKNIDVIGLRLTLPYGSCESVTGFDLGLWGRSRYFEGFQLNLLRNEAEDILSGMQLGIYNTAGNADLVGLQIGLVNEARTITGFQIGIINIADQMQGFQIGLINRSETAYGFQIGGVNVIRESQLAFFPLVNIGFDMFTNY